MLWNSAAFFRHSLYKLGFYIQKYIKLPITAKGNVGWRRVFTRKSYKYSLVFISKKSAAFVCLLKFSKISWFSTENITLPILMDFSTNPVWSSGWYTDLSPRRSQFESQWTQDFIAIFSFLFSCFLAIFDPLSWIIGVKMLYL